ncbi:MAG: hypothetical protein GY908_03550, partial [Flavobacteriales bacterium]|nr:hypothetical protein [Flavobacteriales bacterium]
MNNLTIFLQEKLNYTRNRSLKKSYYSSKGLRILMILGMLLFSISMSFGNEFYSAENVLVEEIVSNKPPELTAVGNNDYCPGPSNSVNIVTTVEIEDEDDTSTEAIYIQISSGYVNGEDLLTLDNLGTHASNGITPSWDAIQGELTLAGPALYTDFEAAIRDVLYSSSSAIASGSRQFSITVGEANYLPSTGHYYEFISVPGITWTAARTAAAARTYYGLQGYLTTLTTQVEADFVGSQALGVGWIGASDAISEGSSSEGEWRWVTGPEAGTQFWNGATGGSTTAPFNFAFWNNNEPNDFPNSGTPQEENYAHITDVSVTSMPGSWNDLPNAGGATGSYAPKGYVVEYGGTTGDPVLSITAITQVNLVEDVAITTQPADQVICLTGNGSFNVVATGSDLVYQWELSTDNGGSFSPLSNGGVYSNVDAATLNITGAMAIMDTYQYRVFVSSSSYGCGDVTSDAATLTLPDVVINRTTTKDPSTCEGTDGRIVIRGLTPGATYSVSYEDDGVAVDPVSITATNTATNSGRVQIFGLDAGVYSNIIVTLDGCSSTPEGPLTLSDPTPPIAEAGSTDELNCLVTSLNLTGSSPTPGVTFAWTTSGTGNIVGGADTATPLVNQPGVYTLTVTDPSTGCTAVDTVTITFLPDTTAPVADAATLTALTGECSVAAPTAPT